MSKRALRASLFILALPAVLFSLMPAGLASDEAEEHGLIENMGAMQTYSHKLVLAIDADNLPLAGFYAHELEETIEAALAIPEYDGQAIGPLVESMLVPTFEQLEDALEQDAQAASERFDGLVNSCNACHQATGFGLIRIQRSDQNPFLQDFSPQP